MAGLDERVAQVLESRGDGEYGCVMKDVNDLRLWEKDLGLR